jgi:hypothetical protein
LNPNECFDELDEAFKNIFKENKDVIQISLNNQDTFSVHQHSDKLFNKTDSILLFSIGDYGKHKMSLYKHNVSKQPLIYYMTKSN